MVVNVVTLFSTQAELCLCNPLYLRPDQVHGEYCFQTGDFGRWKGGQLEICGRKDAQVGMQRVPADFSDIVLE